MNDTILKPKRDLKTVFVPVIFANGEDDDVPGLVAAIGDKPVMFDGRVYAESEDIKIVGRRLIFTKGIWVSGKGPFWPADTYEWVTVTSGNSGRMNYFKDCIFDFGRAPK